MAKTVTRYQTDWQQIAAIVPFYQPSNGRTGLLVYYQNGLRECIADCTCRRVLTELAAYLGTSLPQLRHKAAQEGRSRKVPLCYHPQLCLVPVKFRHERRKNNSTLGYLNLPAVARVLQNDDGTSTIHFHGSSMPLIALQHKATIQSQLACGKMLLAAQYEQLAPEAVADVVRAQRRQFPWER